MKQVRKTVEDTFETHGATIPEKGSGSLKEDVEAWKKIALWKRKGR